MHIYPIKMAKDRTCRELLQLNNKYTNNTIFTCAKILRNSSEREIHEWQKKKRNLKF